MQDRNTRTGEDAEKTLQLYIVDDDSAVRESSLALCEPIELACFTFESGEAFLEHLKTDPFPAGCAIVDLCLCGMSGLAVLKELREHYPFVVPVLITGFADLHQITSEVSRLNAKLVPKPYVGDAFWDAIVESLSIAGKSTIAHQAHSVPCAGRSSDLTGSHLRRNLRILRDPVR